MHYGDLTDATNLIRIVQEVCPAEIYNLAAQSHVQVSFETPEYTNILPMLMVSEHCVCWRPYESLDLAM
jgi:GDP-D-mannose dehydratase